MSLSFIILNVGRKRYIFLNLEICVTKAINLRSIPGGPLKNSSLNLFRTGLVLAYTLVKFATLTSLYIVHVKSEMRSKFFLISSVDNDEVHRLVNFVKVTSTREQINSDFFVGTPVGCILSIFVIITHISN